MPPFLNRLKVHITPLTKFRPETPYGVKTLHAKYFQNRNCGLPIILIFVFGNYCQFRLIMMSTKGLILRRYMAENSKNVNTSQNKTSIFMIFPEKIANQHRKAVLKFQDNYTYLQNKRMRRCGVAPPPIIFERLKLPQQIIYRRKENLSESPNHQKYWENILVSRFYEQFSRNRPNLGHFRKFEKISNS